MIPEPSLAWLDPAGGELQPLARIWATVELERALADGHRLRQQAPEEVTDGQP
jgi:hypothetical protein